jgi:hypothetical protein
MKALLAQMARANTSWQIPSALSSATTDAVGAAALSLADPTTSKRKGGGKNRSGGRNGKGGGGNGGSGGGKDRTKRSKPDGRSQGDGYSDIRDAMYRLLNDNSSISAADLFMRGAHWLSSKAGLAVFEKPCKFPLKPMAGCTWRSPLPADNGRQHPENAYVAGAILYLRCLCGHFTSTIPFQIKPSRAADAALNELFKPVDATSFLSRQ